MTVRMLPPRPAPTRSLMPLPQTPGPLDHLRAIRQQLEEVNKALHRSRFASPQRRALVAYNTMIPLLDRLREITPEDRPGLVSLHALSHWGQATLALDLAEAALEITEVRLHLEVPMAALIKANEARAHLDDAAGHLQAMLTEKRP